MMILYQATKIVYCESQDQTSAFPTRAKTMEVASLGMNRLLAHVLTDGTEIRVKEVDF